MFFNLTNYNYTSDSFFSETSEYWPLFQNLYTDGLPNESALVEYTEGNISVASINGQNIALGTVL